MGSLHLPYATEHCCVGAAAARTVGCHVCETCSTLRFNDDSALLLQVLESGAGIFRALHFLYVMHHRRGIGVRILIWLRSVVVGDFQWMKAEALGGVVADFVW